LRAAGEDLGYPQFSQLLRRRATPANIAAQQAELFRRMVFNILMDNTDDHEKNHAVLVADDGAYTLAPAFDVVPSAQGLGYQAMQVGSGGAESSLENAMSQCTAFGMGNGAGRKIVRDVARGVDSWKKHFRKAGVSPRDVEVLAQYIDGPRLAAQRKAALS